MAESGFWGALKRLFGMGGNKVEHERFCMSCRKVTGGSLAPKEASAGSPPAMDFTCAACGGHTQVLQ